METEGIDGVLLDAVCSRGERHEVSKRKGGSYIGGSTIVGPHTGWFSGVGGNRKRTAKKAVSKNKKRKQRLARIIEEAEAQEEFRRQRREMAQTRLKLHEQVEDQPVPVDHRANARMSRVAVVRKKRARPVLRLKSDKSGADK